MISDIVDDSEVLLINGTVFCVFWSSKRWLSWKITEFLKCDRHPCQDGGTVLHYRWFILLWMFWVMEMEATKKMYFKGRAISRLTQTATVVVTATVTIQKKMLRRWRDRVPSWVGGVVVVEKCNAVVVVVVLGGQDTTHMVPMENWYVAVGCLRLWCFWLWDSSHDTTLTTRGWLGIKKQSSLMPVWFCFKHCIPKVCENGEKFWELKS